LYIITVLKHERKTRKLQQFKPDFALGHWVTGVTHFFLALGLYTTGRKIPELGLAQSCSRRHANYWGGGARGWMSLWVKYWRRRARAAQASQSRRLSVNPETAEHFGAALFGAKGGVALRHPAARQTNDGV